MGIIAQDKPFFTRSRNPLVKRKDIRVVPIKQFLDPEGKKSPEEMGKRATKGADFFKRVTIDVKAGRYRTVDEVSAELKNFWAAIN